MLKSIKRTSHRRHRRRANTVAYLYDAARELCVVTVCKKTNDPERSRFSPTQSV
jgi:hypothetical protein